MEAKYRGNSYYLVRHGEAMTNVMHVVSSVGGKREYPLTEKGKEQARLTGEYLKQENPDFIVSSPILRAKETAGIIQSATGKPHSFDDRLCEPRFGNFEGQGIESFLDFMKQHGGRTAGDPERGIEGYMDIRERVRSFLADTNDFFQGKKIVIVSHSDTLQEIYAELLGEPVGAEQVHDGWFPTPGSCMLVAGETTKEFVPGI